MIYFVFELFCLSKGGSRPKLYVELYLLFVSIGIRVLKHLLEMYSITAHLYEGIYATNNVAKYLNFA